MGVARSIKGAWMGVNAVGRKFWPSITINLSTAPGTSTSSTLVMEDRGDHLYGEVTANFSAHTDVVADRARATVRVDGIPRTSVVEIVASWETPSSYQNFRIYDNSSGVWVFDSTGNGDNQTITVAGQDLSIRIDSGIAYSQTAWFEIYSIKVDGDTIYPI